MNGHVTRLELTTRLQFERSDVSDALENALACTWQQMQDLNDIFSCFQAANLFDIVLRD